MRAILDTLPEATRWQQEAGQLQALQATLKQILPPALAEACRTWRNEAGELVIACASSAVAARVRQITPRIAHHFSAEDHKGMAIRVEVQAYDGTRPVNTPSRQPRPIPPGAADAVEALANRTTASGLAEALHLLAARLRERR